MLNEKEEMFPELVSEFVGSKRMQLQVKLLYDSISIYKKLTFNLMKLVCSHKRWLVFKLGGVNLLGQFNFICFNYPQLWH